ncbi:MAG: pyridoxal-phosphate dependent enzyme, partial [Actinobacteria bacterium]|nr:pyridoxal-phosphate dependent enzyme [Actinomycetota bacterium]
MNGKPGVTREAIASVAPLIGPHLRETPVVRADRADFGLPPGPLVLKLEQLQHSGSFKARGAFANLLLRDVPPAGVVAASGGNHGAAVAYAAHALGVPARIYVPAVSSPAKIARIRGYGAGLVVTGATYADALAASRAWAAGSGALELHAFD